MSDWTGNGKAALATICASACGNVNRQCHDFYATPAKATLALVRLAREDLGERILEPCAGAGDITAVLVGAGKKVVSSDLFPASEFVARQDFNAIKIWDGDIVTNPPYKYAVQFADHAIDIVGGGHHVAFLCRLNWLSSTGRLPFFRRNPPKRVLVFSSRITCAKNGDFAHATGGAVDYAWYVWEKGFAGKPSIDWIDPEDCR